MYGAGRSITASATAMNNNPVPDGASFSKMSLKLQFTNSFQVDNMVQLLSNLNIIFTYNYLLNYF